MRTFLSVLLGVPLTLSGIAAQASHDESVGARFVQPGGIDAGTCLDHHDSCVSIHYALRQAEPGNTIKVGAGVYDMTGISPETFLYGPVHAVGGFDSADHYYESRPEEVQSVVVGLDARYRNILAVRGFHWAEDAAAAARGEASFGGGTALQAEATAAVPCTQGAAGQFPCRNIDFVAQVPLSQFSSRPTSAANLWGFLDVSDLREYAVIGLRNGTAIVEVTDPANPREVVTIPGNSSAWREVKIYQSRDAATGGYRAHAYVATEAANSGIQIIDLSALPQTASLVNTLTDTGTQHTLYISNVDYTTNLGGQSGPQPTLYVAGSNLNGGSWRAYSLADPASPQLVGTSQTTRYMHDSTGFTVTGSRASQCAPGHDPCEILLDFNVEHVEVWDVTNKLQPVLLSTATNPNNRYIHSGWMTAGQNYLIFHDELEEIQFGLPTRLYSMDLTNLGAPTVNVSYQGTTTATDHNGYANGVYYYVSHYRRGLVVFDTSNPTQLVEVGHFDNYLTPAANTAGTEGAWGVYPYFNSGTVLVSDIENGLFVLRDHTRRLRDFNGRVGFASLAHNVPENAGSIAVPIRRVIGQVGEVTVQYTTTAGTATSGTDYTTATGTLTWPLNDLADKTLSIPLTDDTAVEGAETLTVTLSSPTGGATIDGATTLTVTIDDNDAPPPSGGGGGGGGSTSPLSLLLLGLAAAFARRRDVGTLVLAPRQCARRTREAIHALPRGRGA
jgi:choice-of-anchor B domain-containing protein